jgi:hypothetical protein
VIATGIGNAVPQGVSGSTPVLPDQKASHEHPTGGESGTQFCPTNEQTTPEDNRSFQFHLCGDRVRMKKRLAKPWLKLAYTRRSEALATAMKIAEMGIDPQRFLDSKDEMRRIGILLNQVVKLAHQDRAPLDYSERVMAAVEAVEAIVS